MAAQMVDMSYTPKERKEEATELATPQPPAYPWGLEIRLEKDELEKLGITDLPGVGDEFHIMAVGRVTSVSQAYREDTDESKCVSIQLCMMQVMDEGQEPDDSAAEENKEAGSLMKSPKVSGSALSYYGGKK